jgi:hypothetical protein
LIKRYFKKKKTSMSLNTVAEIPLRDYSRVRFTGELANKDGYIDMGGHFMDFRAEVLRRAKDAKSAGILGNQNVIMMPPAVKTALEVRLKSLERAPQPWSSKHLTFMANVRKSLWEESNQQTQRNTQADTVMTIMHEISGRNVQTAMELIAKPFEIHSQKALVEVMRQQEDAYFGDAYVRKDQIKGKVDKVGTAYTTAHLTMLMGILNNIYDHTEEWLTKTNPDGTTGFHDQGTPPISERERIHSLIVRMSDSSHSLGPFRSMVSDGLAAGDTFKTIVRNIAVKMKTNIPSLVQASLQGQETALLARVDELGDDSRFVAFQAGFQMATAQGDKRQRMEEVRPYASAPQASIKPMVSCHYWNGDNCDFEVTTKRQCRFQEGHVQGVNTFVKPFVAKQPEMEQSERYKFQEWKRMKDLSSQK